MSSSVVELTQQLVQIRSDYPETLETRIGNFLVEKLKDLGFSVETQSPTNSAERFNIFATRGQGKKAVLFYGHQDTVPLADGQSWSHPAFAGEIEGDKLFGLGSYDMKGGIAAFLVAAETTSAYMKVFLPFDEENISEGAWLAVHDRSEFFADVGFVISPEPNFGLGIHNIPTARPGRSVYQVKLAANASHVAEYMQGEDAVLVLSKFIDAFHNTFHNPQQPFFSSPYSLAMIRKVASESVGITAPSEADVEIEVYLDKSDNEQSFLDAVKAIAHTEVVLIPRKTPYLKAYRFDDFPLKKEIEKIILDHTGKKMTNLTYSAVGDDNVVASMGAPVLTWGPDGANAHAVDEYVSISSLEKLTQMFSKVLKYAEDGSDLL